MNAMEWLLSIIKNNPHVAISFPTLLSIFSFIQNLLAALSDGVIDSNELHQLMSSANGIETAILIIIMIALKEKKQ